MLLNLYNTISNYAKYQMGELRDQRFSGCDFICYYGGINWDSIDIWRSTISTLGDTCKQRDVNKIVIFLSTLGGSASAVERMVEITRHYYEEVYFVIPGFAMSAGTIWTMSGDKVYMNYASALGPIDPQVQSMDGKWVPALGYLDKVKEIIEKSRNNDVTQAELMMINQLDLAQLRQYEQAAELSVDLLKTWLVKYKFKNWVTHRTTNKGDPVTIEEKKARAQEIAYSLSDNSRWHSHGRFIGINTLKDDLRLEIDDFSNDQEMSILVQNLHSFLNEHIEKFGIPILVESAIPANIEKLN